MTTRQTSIFTILFATAASPTFAAPLSQNTDVVSCRLSAKTGGIQFASLKTDGYGRFSAIIEDESGKFHLVSGVRQNSLENAASGNWTNLKMIMQEINLTRDTGIRWEQIAFVQAYTISGNSDFKNSMIQIFDAQKKSLGWIAFFGNISGCY